MKKFNFYLYGLKKGIPVALAYFAVSFAFGVMMKNGGMSPLVLLIMSLISFSSAGELAGAELILHVASYFELFITIILINLRYALMSLSLSQKIDPKTPWWKRILMSFGIADELYAITITEKKEINLSYILGLATLPFIAWAFGTFLGSLGASLFPEKILIALNFALYSMFIAIIIPDCKKNYKVLIVILIAISLSCMFYYVPYIKEIGLGFKIVLSTIIACLVGAIFFKVKDEENIIKDEDNV